MGKNHIGYCRLCMQHGKLSYEHVPPKSAFNKESRAFKTMQDLLEGRGQSTFRQGLGVYSLCESCNNLTGAWYGEAFAEWSRQGLDGLERLQRTGNKSIYLPYYVRPLNIIKQIVVMALAMAPETAIVPNQDLRQFVLNREQRYLPTPDKIYIYHSLRGMPRFASGMVIMNIYTHAASYVRGEIAIPPFGYCISDPVGDMRQMGEAEGLCDITWFARYSFEEYARINLRIPGMETNTPMAFDYRTETEVETKSDL